jgi:UDP-N-acetylmuramate dehydrogenase
VTRVRENVPFSELTTLRLGGPARTLLEAADDEEAVDAVREAEAAGGPLLMMAGGSNLVVADEGFPGTVVRVASRGVERRAEDGRVELDVAAGEPWDDMVALAVAEGLAGIECLSGIPGSTGATPIQNVGAYGQEVAETITAVRAYDRQAGEVRSLAPRECGFTYRSSAFKGSARHLVLGVSFALRRAGESSPIGYAGLARSLGVPEGAGAPLAEVREGVLALRRSKGMVIDPDDPDSVSAGSFFTNPILEVEDFARLEKRAAEQLGRGARPPRFSEPDGRVKTSAAWLIERAGFGRGYGDGRVRLSDKHTLAITNRGGGTAAELLALARELRDGVRSTFGVELVPEPSLVGLAL